MNSVGTTIGRPRSAKGILVLPFVVFWHEKADDRWSPLQIVTARSLQGVTKDKFFFTQQGDEHLRPLRQTFIFDWRNRLFA